MLLKKFGQISFCLMLCIGDKAVLAAEDLPVLDLTSPIRPNFAGAWEKDFRRSDDWEQELTRTINALQRDLDRQAGRSSSNTSQRPAVSIGNSSSASRGLNIIDLARLAEYISRPLVMEISQDRKEVKIERKNDATLTCSTQNNATETFASEYGSEICGWDGQQLVFEISLPNDVKILHRLSISSDSQDLNMVTRVSRRRAQPFSLIQVFRRYDAPPDGLYCRQTLSRGNVCSQAGGLR